MDVGKAIQEGIIWVVNNYPDGSKHKFRTTLNENILRQHGIYTLEDNLIDLKNNKVVEIVEDMEFYEEEPTLDEFNEYIAQFL